MRDDVCPIGVLLHVAFDAVRPGVEGGPECRKGVLVMDRVQTAVRKDKGPFRPGAAHPGTVIPARGRLSIA